MKKNFAYLMLVFAILFGGVLMANAQSKALQKDVKKRAKELKKEGWKMQASTTTLDYALLQYRTYMEEDQDNRIAITGVAIGKNVKIGRENAIMSGISSYANRAKAQVVGKLKGIISADASSPVAIEEIDKFGAAYESAVNTKIGPLVKQHFVLVRDLADGSKEFNVFMSIDEGAAKRAREQAAEEAKKQASLQTLSEQVEEFIGEPVVSEE